MPEDAPILIAGRYELLRLLGRGATAVVHEGYDQRLARPVAIKLMLPEVSVDADFRKRFGDEAKAAARFSHANVVGIYDVGLYENRPFLVLERLPGVTLADLLAKGPMSSARLVPMLLDVLRALHAAHGHGIVHRDIKPGNVLITDDLRAKVADFGLAKGGESATLTRAGTVMGTPAYLSPERVTGEPATPADDVYAVGVMLWEGLAGQKPYKADTAIETAKAVAKSRAPRLRSINPGADAHIAAVAERAISRDLTERYVTATALAEALAESAGFTDLLGFTAGWGTATEGEQSQVADDHGPSRNEGLASRSEPGGEGQAGGDPDPTHALESAPPSEHPLPRVSPLPHVPTAHYESDTRGAAPVSDSGASPYAIDTLRHRRVLRRRRRTLLVAAALVAVVVVGLVWWLFPYRTVTNPDVVVTTTQPAPTIQETTSTEAETTTSTEAPTTVPVKPTVTARPPITQAPATTSAPSTTTADSTTTHPSTTAAPGHTTTTPRPTTTSTTVRVP